MNWKYSNPLLVRGSTIARIHGLVEVSFLSNTGRVLKVQVLITRVP